MLDQTSRKILIKDRVNLFRHRGVNAVWTRRDGCTARRNCKLERKKRTRSKVGGGTREDIMIVAQDVTKLSDDIRSPTRTMEIKRNLTEMAGELIPYVGKTLTLFRRQPLEKSRRRRRKRSTGRTRVLFAALRRRGSLMQIIHEGVINAMRGRRINAICRNRTRNPAARSSGGILSRRLKTIAQTVARHSTERHAKKGSRSCTQNVAWFE